jgi:PAS domain S-box-containing protein
MLSIVGVALPIAPLPGARRAAGRGLTHTLTRLIVTASFPLSAAMLVAGLITGEPLLIAGGAGGLAAPILGSVQLLVNRPHPTILIVLWIPSVLALAPIPVPVVAEASSLGLAALATAVILYHAPRHAALYLTAVGAMAGATMMLVHGVGIASGVAAVILAVTIWGTTVLHGYVGRKLRHSEARFRGSFEDAPIAMLLADDDGIRRVNPAFEALLGYREAEVRGRSLETIIPPGDIPVSQQATPAAPFERRYLRRDGGIIWGQTAITTVRDAAADQAHHVVQILDVTRRHAQNEAIRSAEERQRSLLSCMPVALWEEDFSAVGEWLESKRRAGVTDVREHFRLHPEEVKEGAGLVRVVDVNDAAARLIQAPSKEALIGGLHQSTFTEETRDSFVEQFAAIWEGRNTVSVEVIGSTVDGRRIACELQWAVPVVAGERDLRRVVVAITDLTESNQTKAELQRRVALENLIAKLSTDFINLRPEKTDEGIERALQVIGSHAGAGRSYLFRFSPDGTSMTNTHEWCAPDVAPMKQRIQGVPIDDFPWVCEPLKAGRAIVVPRVADLPAEASAERAEFEAQGITSLIIVPMVKTGSVMGFVGFDSLASGRSWSEADIGLLGLIGEMFVNAAERKTAGERLAALMRSKDELIAAVSHELRTPLTAILGFAEELQSADNLPAEERSQLLGLIVEQGRDLSHLVEDLLVASRLETGQLKVAPERISLREQVAQTLRGLQLPEGRSVEPPADDATVCADALRVRQVLRNLLTNAVRYGGARIGIDIEQRGRSVALVVGDDGPGVPAHEQDRIFEPYERAHETPGRPGSIGLGLSVSRQLARLMGGDLHYRRGTTSAFELVLPAAEPQVVRAPGIEGTATVAFLHRDPFPPDPLPAQRAWAEAGA